MGFVGPVPIIRRNYIIRRLKKCGAVSEQTAKTLEAAGVFNPRAFPRVNDVLVRQGILAKTADGRYYLLK